MNTHMNWIIGILVALLVCVGCVLFFLPHTFTIVSYNVCHGEGMDNKVDLGRTARIIAAEKPRFAAICEMDTNAKRSNYVNEPEELARLTKMHATFAQAIPFDKGGYGVALLSREKPLSTQRIPLPGTEKRVLLIVEFRDCFVGVTHLDLLEAARLESVQIIRAALKSCAAKPLFLCGDWNAYPDSKVMATMQEFLTLLSKTTEGTYHGHHADGSPQDATGKCIDYIAIDSAHAAKVKAYNYRVVNERVASDHAPIALNVILWP